MKISGVAPEVTDIEDEIIVPVLLKCGFVYGFNIKQPSFKSVLGSKEIDLIMKMIYR